MSSFRIIPRLEVKSNYVIKGMRMEGFKKIGNPIELASKFSKLKFDEISYQDITASWFGSEINIEQIKKVSDKINIPLSVSGGIKDIKLAKKLLDNGADKIILNTHAVENPNLIEELARIYGSQSVSVSIHFKKIDNNYEVLTENGRKRTHINIFDWLDVVQDYGIGEISIISINNDGMNKMIEDIKLLKDIRKKVNVPLLYGGGVDSKKTIKKLVKLNFDGVHLSRLLYLNKKNIKSLTKGIN
jgi:cyclase